MIDLDNDEWVRNDEGTYDLHGNDVRALHRGRTLDYIRTNFGILED